MPRGVVLSARFRATLILLAAAAGVALGASLGQWQLRRAAVKIATQQALESQALLPPLKAGELSLQGDGAAAQYGRTVRLIGHWVGAHTVFLENRQMQGRVGFVVVTPLQLEGRRVAVLVQRGWVPRDFRDRSLLPQVPTPDGQVEIEGRIAPPPARLYEFAGAASGVIRQNLDLGGFAAESGLQLAPMSVQQFAIRQFATSADGLQRQWPQPAADVQKHYGYAFQWFALASLIAGLYVWFQLIRPRIARHGRK